MKIAHVVSGYLPQDSGGTQMQLRDLCHAQRRRGHEVHVFTRLAGDDHSELELTRSDWEGVPVTAVTNNFSDCDRFERVYTHPVIDQRFDAFLDQEDPDLVHVHHLTCLSTTMVEVAKRRSLPVVMWLSDYWLSCPRGQRLYPEDLSICEDLDRERCLPCLQKLWPHLLPEGALSGTPEDPSMAKLLAWEAHTQRMIALCDATLTPSAFHRDRFLETGIPAERCHVVKYGLPHDELIAPPRGRRPIKHIGYTGMVIPSKGVHILVEAFNLLDRRDLVLDIHGEVLPFHGKTSYLDGLKASVKPGLTVSFHGRFENRDLPQVLAGLDMLVIPSMWWESYCLTAREGALAGLPVIVFDLAGLAEAVDEGLALGCEVGNARQLAEVMARLCDDPELRDEMSRKAHLVRKVDDCAEHIEQIYDLARARARESPPLSEAPGVSLVILTWNAGPEFPEILGLMLDQELDRPMEVVVIDSGSTDGTVELLKTQPVRLIEIPNSEFNHGLTRNRGILEARGDIVVLATQDARPVDRRWIARLVACYDDPDVAGAYSCQLPRPDANPFIKDRLSHWAAAQPEPRVQQVENRAEFEALPPLEQLGRVAFDDVSSSVRRSVALEIPFRERQFGEDIDWAHRAILEGHKIVFEPRSRVVHSHNNSIWYEFKRVYLDHQNLHRIFGVHTVPRWQDVSTCTRGGIRHLRDVVDQEPLLSPWQRFKWRLLAVPYSFTQNLAQYLGARSVYGLWDGSLLAELIDRILRRGV